MASNLTAQVRNIAGVTIAVASGDLSCQSPEGIACARRFAPELVICDIGLPGMVGYEVARILRREPATADAHLIALSGYAQEEDVRRTREAGFHWHLRKPVEDNELLRTPSLVPCPDRCLAT